MKVFYCTLDDDHQLLIKHGNRWIMVSNNWLSWSGKGLITISKENMFELSADMIKGWFDWRDFDNMWKCGHYMTGEGQESWYSIADAVDHGIIIYDDSIKDCLTYWQAAARGFLEMWRGSHDNDPEMSDLFDTLKYTTLDAVQQTVLIWKQIQSEIFREQAYLDSDSCIV